MLFLYSLLMSLVFALFFMFHFCPFLGIKPLLLRVYFNYYLLGLLCFETRLQQRQWYSLPLWLFHYTHFLNLSTPGPRSLQLSFQVGNTGFSIGAARKVNGLSLVIGPGAGYNLVSF